MTHRLLAFAALCGLVVLTATGPWPAPAADPQDKKGKEALLQRELIEARTELALLRQKNVQLQSQLKKEKSDADDKTIKALRKDVSDLQQKNTQLQAQLKKEKNDGSDKTIKTLQTQLDTVKKAGYVHSVIFRLKSDTPQSEIDDLLSDVPELLGKIKTVRGIWAGRPAKEATPDVAVRDYDVGLLVLFDNADGLKKYLDDPLHKKFADKHLKLWQAPQVYDYQQK